MVKQETTYLTIHKKIDVVQGHYIPLLLKALKMIRWKKKNVLIIENIFYHVVKSNLKSPTLNFINTLNDLSVYSSKTQNSIMKSTKSKILPSRNVKF